MTGHGNGTGIFGRYRAPSSQATLSLRNVTISGFTEAIEFWMNTNGDQSVENTLVMENVRIDCETTGLAVMVRDARIRDLEIKGCRDVAAMVEVHGEAEVQDSRFSESETGLLVHAYGRAELRDSEFSDNRGIGINGQENGRMEMTGVKVLRNGYLGIGTWPDGFVHDSVIEGNGFGLDAAGGFPYDATNNYWGDPNGPSVCSAGPDLKPPVGGDCTTHLVTFYPFRSSPP